MNDPAPYHVDIEGLAESGDGHGKIEPPNRPWVGIQFDCCGVYTRVYRNKEHTAYAGRCPRCCRSINLRIGPGGTESRFFVAE